MVSILISRWNDKICDNVRTIYRGKKEWREENTHGIGPDLFETGPVPGRGTEMAVEDTI